MVVVTCNVWEINWQGPVGISWDLLQAWRAESRETTLHGLHGEREASPFCRRR